MTYSEPTAQFPTALVTAADLLKPENDATSTTLLQNITSGSPAAGGKLYVNDNANFSTNGGVALIDSTTELIGYSATGSDGTGDYLTVDQRAYPGGSAASAASSGDTVKDVVSAEHFKRVHVELIATQTYLGTNASQTAPIADSVLAGTGAGVSSWDTTPTVAGLTINGASGNTLVVDTNTLVVDATNGRVGAGTASPGARLEVSGNSGTYIAEFVTSGGSYRGLRIQHAQTATTTGATGAALVLQNTNNTANNFAVLSFEDSSGNSIGYISGRILDHTNHYGDFWFTTRGADGWNDRMVITSAGLVGINETSPGAQLHVVSSAAGTHIAVFEAAATPSANLIEVNSNGATGGDLLVVDKNGQVGIGTASPKYLLDVGGVSSSSWYGVISTAPNHNTAYSTTALSGAGETGLFIQNINAAAAFSSLKLSTRETLQSSWEISNVWTGNYVGDLTFKGRTGGATYQEYMRITSEGNIGISTTTFDGTAAGVLAIANGTAPALGTTGQAYIYAKDVAASSEMHVMNEAGFETQISPHDPETGEWVFYSKNTRTGKVLRVQMERLVKFLNSEFGTDFVQEFVEAV